MFRAMIVAVLLSVCTQPSAWAHNGPQPQDDLRGLTISITRCDVGDATLDISYRISNGSVDDVWVMAGFYNHGCDLIAKVDRDNSTLRLSRSLDLPSTGGYGDKPDARHVLLRPGESRTEWARMSLPAYAGSGELVDGQWRVREGREYASRLVVEIGYHGGDLPERMRQLARRADALRYPPHNHEEGVLMACFRSSLKYNRVNEVLMDRDREILVPYTYQWLRGERLLHAEADGLRIPYEQWPYLNPTELKLDPNDCTRLEIRFRPSMLQYFFPYEAQQNVLAHDEIEWLRSDRTVATEDRGLVRAFLENVNQGVPRGEGVVCAYTAADVICYGDGEPIASFTICDDHMVALNPKERFWYQQGLPVLQRLIPQFEPLAERVQCATNLKNLKWWLEMYRRVERPPNAYHPARVWCTILGGYESVRIPWGWEPRDPFQCPSAGAGKCHYAMNPDCEPNSPGDTVLLFETKAGWNQHGGPELFAFDNHDPKGGCVLLNDGTIKFIRTKEELALLRWRP